MQRLALASLAALVLAVPSAAHATIGLRAGLEAPLVTHTSNGTYGFTDSLQPAIDLMLSAYPSSLLGFDVELREGFAGTGSSAFSHRTGTSVGPGITLSPPLLPVYVRAALPIHIEPGDVTFGLRAAAGLSFNLVVLSIYVEGAADFPLAGNNVTPFNTQQFSAGAGVWFKF